ncbi:Hypothetical_protein [Hexamita inflata]|uniref:Hypothetical_protein n=1 Tax=Hexamita inflata TaxID=28002 RepID=A0AA86QAN7_9EUKA|nr:Hypothetical protein HINF_LOCUS39578 [Hexamita inflata]
MFQEVLNATKLDLKTRVVNLPGLLQREWGGHMSRMLFVHDHIKIVSADSMAKKTSFETNPALMQYFALNQTFASALNKYLNWMADSITNLYNFGNTLDKILLCRGIPDVSPLQLFCADSYCLQYDRIQRKRKKLDYTTVVGPRNAFLNQEEE